MTARRTRSEVDAELDKFASLGRDARMIALSVIAHDLTVGIRAALSELPSPEAAKRAQFLNECLHQITGRISSSNDHSAIEEREMLSDLAEEAEQKGLKLLVTRRFGAAVRYALVHDRSHAIA